MKTIKNKLLRTTAVLLAVITVFSIMFALPVSAVSDEVTIVFDYCYDSTGNTIKFQQESTNDGYTVGVAGEELCKIFANDEEAYCIEPGHSLFSYDTLKKDATTVWRDLGSAKQKAINLALLYGKPGSGSSLSGTDDQKWVATQLIVWELVSDCRETKNGFKCTNTKFIDGITAGGANPGVKTVYNEISNSLANYATVPSFASAVLSKAETYELKPNGNSYELTLTDDNNILSKFDFQSTNGVTVSKTENKITLKSSLPLTEEVTFNCAKLMPNVGKAVLVPYGDVNQQDIITGVENDNDPIRAYFKVKTSQGNLKIVKTSEDGKVANVKFKITGDNYSDEVTTNTNGEIEIKNLKVGTYTITEIVSAEYEAQKSQTVTVENGKTAIVKFNNTLKKSEIKIVKKDAETKKTIPLSGFGFKIKKSDASFVTADKKDVFYTDNTGTITLPIKLTYGKYQLVEVSAGTGYVLDSTPIDFEVNGENKTIELVKYNKPQKATITVTKTGDIFSSVKETSETSKENPLKVYQPVYSNGKLSGVEFKITAGEDIITPDGTVRYKKGDTVDNITTDKNGQAVSKQLYLGKYYVTETKAVSGYVLNRESYPVTLKYAGQNVEVTNSSVTVNNKRQKAEITLTKIFEVNEKLNIGKKAEIKNVSFAFYANEEIKASDGKIIPKDGLIEILSVSENGKATFITNIPFGKYYVQEYTTDKHYVLDNTKYEFEFSYTDDNTSVQKIEINNGKAIVNKPLTGGLEITKKDVSTGELLPNAGFRIKDKNGNIVVEGYTDEKGVAKFTLGYGKYTYEEFDAPDGCIIDTTPHEFEITENGKIVKAEMTNKKQPEPDKPQTGDSSNIGFYIGLGAFAIGGLVAFVIIKFRKKDKDED
ncbi:MAG: SpaA isopeptide-forming pilin-related protein [Acutalibacteraceae bacterium]|nr:SpaA isopeptide-forming pilin-related protein [Acutalibacteraceae bacterium]